MIKMNLLTTELTPALVQHVLDRLQNDLPPEFTFHNAVHTTYVLGCAHLVALEENLPDSDHSLLAVAALYHDIGFLKGAANHEDTGCAIACAELPAFEYTPDEIEIVCGMIMATHLPQNPKTHAERILADVDLYYLGTDKYVEFSGMLFKELQHFDPSLSRKAWIDIQIDFLSNHHYHTAYAKEHLEPIKQANLHFLKEEGMG